MLNNKYFVSYGSINQNTNILQQGYYKNTGIHKLNLS